MPVPENPSSPDHDPVDEAAIADLRGNPQSIDDLYTRLQQAAPEISYWLCHRASELYDDIDTRGSEARLALELATIMLTRSSQHERVAEEIANLQSMFGYKPPLTPES